MDEELLKLLASTDALTPLLPDIPLCSAESLELTTLSTSSVSNELDTTTGSKRDTEIERKREFRRKKKAEAEALRSQYKQLEAQLDALRIQARRSTNVEVIGWKAISQRQRQRRLEVMAINKQLKACVRFYHEAALRLTEILPAVLRNSSSETSVNVPSVTVNSWDVEMMHRLSRETNDMRAEIDEVVASGPQVDLAPGSSHAMQQVWRCDGVPGNAVVEASEVMTMPFDLEDAFEALQRTLLKSYSQVCKPVVISEPDDKTLVVAKVYFPPSVGEDTDAPVSLFEGLFASRVFVEQDRVLFAWRSVIRQRGDHEHWSSTVHVAFAYWGVGVQTDSEDLSAKSEMRFLSRLHLCNYKSLTAGGGPHDEVLLQYVEQLRNLSEEDANEFQWSIENEILDNKSSKANAQ